MKKLWLTVAVLLIVCLTACVFVACGEDDEQDEIEDGFADISYNAVSVAENMPEEYWIEYTITVGDEQGSSSFQMVVAKNQNGVYSKAMNSERVWLKAEDGTYETYQKGEGGWEVTATDVTAADVQLVESEFVMNYAAIYLTYKDFLNQGEDKTIVGKRCYNFYYDLSSWAALSQVENASASINYYVEAETGICLELQVSASAEDESGSTSWLCTKYQTENVELPSVIAQE